MMPKEMATRVRELWIGILLATLVLMSPDALGSAATLTVNYGYDSLNRLTWVTYSTGAQVSYVYDEVGNRLTRVAAIPNYTLTVTSTPNSDILINVSSPDITGQGKGLTPFALTYAPSASVTLTAPNTASNGSSFQRWQKDGVDAGTNPSIPVNMDANHTMNAVYTTQPAYTLTISPAPTNGRIVGPGINCGTNGTDCTELLSGPILLTAIPDAGYRVNSWSGVCASAIGTTCKVVMTQAQTPNVSFSPMPSKNPPAFSPSAQVPVLNSPGIDVGKVLKLESNEYRMYYSDGGSISLLESVDGLAWDPASAISGVVSPSTTGYTYNRGGTEVKEDGIYKMWIYATNEGNIAGTNVYLLTSTNGRDYASQGLALSNGTDPEYDSRNTNDPMVVSVGGRYFLYYTAAVGPDTGPPPASSLTIGIAVSEDGGQTFTKQGHLDVGASGTFDAGHLYAPVVLYDPTAHIFEMFYTGDDAVGIQKIGYAISGDGLTWTKVGPVDSLGTGVRVVGAVKEGAVYRLWYVKTSTGEVWRATAARAHAVAVWRPAEGNWYIRNSQTAPVTVQQWGAPTDIPIPGDYDGDGTTDIAVWRPAGGNWYILNSSTLPAPVTVQQWGAPTDKPVPGDYDGDGTTDIAVWRPSDGNWYIRNSQTGTVTVTQWGTTGDVPVPGDYDGDDTADIAVWRPSDGNWYIRNSQTGTVTVQQWGTTGDVPVAGDYDGDGKTDIAVWRPSDGNWYIRNSQTGTVTVQQWGTTGDVPVAGDYDGDGKTDIAVWRPGDGNWYIRNSQTGTVTVQQWGAPTDRPVVGRW